YAALTLFLFTLVIESSHTRLHGRRHKRQHGAHLYLPESFIVPEGEGYPGEWGDWGSPSECSRTCGGGVAYQTRECLNVGSDGSPRCTGGNKKYFSCNSQDCPESEPDFRQQQCSHFDSVPFEGVRYTWVPYTKAPNPCELNCMPKGERFYYRHKAKVIDGTPCNDESLDVCVNGQCQPVGCDMMLGSSAREDKCRKCAGDGTSCKTVSGILDMNDLQVGYNDILLIPSSATNIEIREISPSNNYLAIRNLSGHYYLNGNWRIDFPRPLTFANAIWHYDRKPQGFAAPDHVSCMGPISEPVYLVLLYQDRNVGIRYEYSVPESSAYLSEPETYAWTFTDFGPCSSTCGGGVQTRSVTCNGRTNLTRVEDELCDISNKPNESQKCGAGPCPANWKEGPYGKCSAPCGNNGTQTRSVTCEKVLENGSSQPIDDSVCLGQVGAKPATISECNVGKICGEWHVGSWQPCDKLCGPGTQKRKLKCFHKVNGKIEALDDEECIDEKPESTRECTLRPCEGVDWITSTWSGCKTCGLNQETRTAHCASKSGTIYNETFCANRKKPELTRECKAPACDYQWFKSQWTKCSAECGNGVQSRQVICGKLDGNSVQKSDDESKCSEEKPIAEKECSVDKECPGQWFSGPWGECDKKCGGGKRTRKVLCIANGVPVKETDCSEDTIEFRTDDCNKDACIEDETIPVDSTSKPITEDDEGEDWCDEDDETGTTDDMEIVKVIPTDSTGISDIFEVDSTSDATESSFITDDLMLSDATGFETDSTQTDSVTDISIATVDGSGDYSEAERFGGTDGSGDDDSTATTDSLVSRASTDEASDLTQSAGSDSTDQPGSDSTDQSGSDSTDQPGSDSTDQSGSDSTDQPGSDSTDKSGSDSTDQPGSDSTDQTGSDSTDKSGSDSTDQPGSDSTQQSGSDSTDQPGSDSTQQSGSDSTDKTGSDATESESSTDTVSSLSSSQLSSDSTDSETTSDSATTETDAAETSSTETSSASDTTSDLPTTDTTFETTTDITADTTTDITADTTTDIITTESTESTTDESTQGTTEGATDGTTEQDTKGTTEGNTEVTTDGNTEVTTDGNTEGSTAGATETASDSAETSTLSGASSDLSEATTLSSVSELSTSSDTESSTGISDGESSTDASEVTTDAAGITTDAAGITTDAADVTTDAADVTTDAADGTTDAADVTTEAAGTSVTESGTDSTSSADLSDASTTISGDTSEADVTETTDAAGSTQSTIAPSTGEDVEGTTIDIWSTTDASAETDEDEKWGSTPNTLEAIITKEQTPKKCKPRPKVAACLKTKFGCCSDNTTAATGPFDEGCPVPETCADTKYGCCPDGLSPAEGKDNKGCPQAECVDSLFGCCSDGITEAENEEQIGCPIITTTAEPETTTIQTTEKAEPDKTAKSAKVDKEAPTTDTKEPHKFCQDSTYGCCQDGISEATGPGFHGCDCKKSQFGCCSDGRTPAEGPNQEGCSPCLTEPFGCCRDGVTPAHGPNLEGCCLDSKYGCCPNNINAARGPNLEDCGCEYTPYGCCPDKVTSARGRDNEGCGCEHSPHGCCADKLTPAQGPKFEGCPCHTFQFGCCPDGVTVPQGPLNYGCHCAQTEFKCCSDEITPAKGPNFEGCTCANSKYGCCLDGQTEANGTNYEGCDEIPKTPQKSCSLPKDSGTCANFTVKNFFDVEYGACSRFWYSGCGGNDNRFETMEDCKGTCEQAEGKAACLLPKIHGPCTGYYPSFYYDSDRNMCSQFVYGGCLGNNNRFETIEACQELCVVDKTSPPCEQPVDEGPCHGSFESWYFDKESDTCRQFYFGGCKGNKNRYATEHACNYHCKTPGIHKESCSLPKETGSCGGRQARWYYSQSDKKCMPFYYSGCDGNKNSFVSQEECEQQCPPQIIKDLCAKPAELGEGQNYVTRWYYDTKEERCRQFYYGGFGGNDNNFLDEQSCLARCEQQQTTTTTQRSRPREEEQQQPRQPQSGSGDETNICFLDYDSGECRVSEARYYYNKVDGFCDVFAYGGCGGNANNFRSVEECEQQCGHVQDPCTMPPVYGQCQDNLTRWYYDQRSEECYEFSFTGCAGNKNNFHSERDCRNQCARRTDPRNERTEAPPREEDNSTESICDAPMEYGDCSDNVLSYFYRPDTSTCEAFYYSGCGGNGNRFETEEQCQRQCGSYRGVDVCHERVDAGPCDQWQTRYFYNQRERRCEAFMYGGCEGNGNRFNSLSECQSICISHEEPANNDNKAVCTLPVLVGKCLDSQDYHKRWYYDDSRGNCVSFIYSGCAGNQNNFRSYESCTEYCGNLQPDDSENSIDHGDIRTEVPDVCQQYNEACNRLNCPYGISRSYGPEDGCERCECDDPCRGYLCPDDAQCSVDLTADSQLGTAFTPICRKVNKPGECPTLGNSSRCDRECYNDADCRGESKCCTAGCGYVCSLPVDTAAANVPEPVTPPVYYPGAQAPQLEDVPQEEVDVVQTEGDVATLRCFATGYPLPTVTWKRNQLIINTNQDRYVLTSTGDLQIVQIHRSDSGTYVCIADNGIGTPVQREVNLQVSDPVPLKAYILGETNSTKILSLNQPATVRCLAGGNPKPYVSWWRGTEMLSPLSVRHEINRDFSLVFQRLELSDLGPYVCQAYSGQGKPVSMHVVLKAVGPVHVRNKDDEQYLKYLVSSPEAPTTPRPDPRYPYRPVVKPPRVIPRPDVPVVVEEPEQPSVRVTAEMILPNGHNFAVGSEISITCNVGGYPVPAVKWYKNDVELIADSRVRIGESPHQLSITDVNSDDAGYYKCAANNNLSSAYHAEQIIIDGVYVPADCTDNPFFANCKLIVKAKYCQHKYYAKFCCKSCTLAGQLYYTANRTY
ncbi:Papilin, partial [Pseudolycoriella hygida]